MNIDPNSPAYPNSREWSNGHIDGISIRAHIAAMAMSHHFPREVVQEMLQEGWNYHDAMAILCIRHADSLISKLNTP